ncbi:MAG: TIGR02757 family protein [Rectinemataceae bacterium]
MRRVYKPSYDPDIATFLETVHAACSGRRRLDRDPLAIVATYASLADREVAGLVASILAFGSVDLIMDAVRRALAPLGPSPASVLDRMDESDIAEAWGGFQYRFCFPKDMTGVFRSIKAVRREYGSLEALFAACDDGGPDVTAACGAFVRALRLAGARTAAAAAIRPNLLPDTADGSACKRIFLFLRWMVRRDGVDPGGWKAVDPSRLVVPMDVHMFRTCRDRLGFFGPWRGEGSAAPRLSDALAATAAFRLYAPHDPVRYDFALTRPGIDPRPGDEVFDCG